jgi:hypothetical protein
MRFELGPYFQPRVTEIFKQYKTVQEGASYIKSTN